MIKSKGLWIGLMVGAFGVSAFAADTQKVIEVQSVQSKLSEVHASWRAKESWVSRLSRDELVRMMGVQRPPKGELTFSSEPQAGKASAIDWRNVNGVNWLGGVMNQGNCGSCVAFATVATMEARMSIAAGAPWLRPTLSPQALFACGGGACDYGWTPDSAADYLKTTGIPDEACMPYTSGSTGVDGQCSDKCADADSRNQRIAGSSMPTSYGGSMDAVKAALKNGPLVTTLYVYADFVTYGSGIYKHVTGDALGGHAVSLVGYDDSKRAWLIRNSWGNEWGENGFAWVSYDDRSGVASDTWDFQMSSGQNTMSVVSPADRDYVSGQYQLVARNQGVKGPIQFHVTDGSGRDMGTLPCAARDAASCTAQLDSTTLKEGRYEVFAQSGSTKTQIREFFVLNSEPKLSLSFAPVAGTDLTKPLHDRPEFTVQASSGAVPMQFVEFRVIDSNGKIVSTKSNPYVLENMRMGWRTMTVKDGQYTILFHGELPYNGKVYSVDSNSYSVTVKN